VRVALAYAQSIPLFQQLARGNPDRCLAVKYPLSLRNVEDLLAERGIDICHETVRQWWNRFGPVFAAEIKKKRISARRGIPEWRWHVDDVFVSLANC
jgi:putative transposase